MPETRAGSLATAGPELAEALDAIAEEAARLDRAPAFPAGAFAALKAAGALAVTVPRVDGSTLGAAEEWRVVREVARASGSAGRILDGHLNAVERIAVAAPERIRGEELSAVANGGRLLGVWGADPAPEEGSPATLVEREGRLVLDGVKVFCSGAGGLDAALVMVRGETAGAPHLCLVEMDSTVEVDRTWFAAGGLRASESHRVIFHGTPVRALIGERGELSREPWFSRDALRTAASWAGMIDSAADDATADLAARRRGEDLSRLAAGRIAAERATVDVWFEAAATAVEAGRPLRSLSIRLRSAVIESSRAILEQAARACGSRPFALGSPLDRARRDLELFTLQHRIDPMLIAEGKRLLEPEIPAS